MPRPHGAQATNWWGLTVPPTSVSIGALTWIGGVFTFNVPGRISGVRAYVMPGVTMPWFALVWDHDTLKQTRAYHFRLDVPQVSRLWLNTWFRPWLRVDTSHTYFMCVLMATIYGRQNGALASPITRGPATMRSSFQTTSINPLVTAVTENSNANGVDLMFQADY